MYASFLSIIKQLELTLPCSTTIDLNFKFLFLCLINEFFFKNSAMSNNQKSFYDLEIESINGEIIKLKEYRDKVILIVNTASYCGFTKQYEDLQDLWDKYKSKGLIVIGVPSDTFNQEKKPIVR